MRAAFLLPILLLAGCNAAFSEAQEAVKRQLTDPESAQFRDMRRCPQGNGVTGEVNSRNRMGGYVGFVPFHYADGRVAISGEGGDIELLELLSRQCYGQSAATNDTAGASDLPADLGPIDNASFAPPPPVSDLQAPETGGEPMHGPYDEEQPLPEPESRPEIETNQLPEEPAQNRVAETPGM